MRVPRWMHAWLLGAATCANATAVSVSVHNAGNAAVADAVIVFDALDSRPAPAHATAVVDQINKRFVPALSIVQTGTSVAFPNSDHIRHQVYSFSPAKTFNLKLYAGSPKVDVPFDTPGLVVLGCNIHDTMVGFIAVVDTPYFGKTGEDGRLRIDLPPGSYRMRVWHPAMAGAFAPLSIMLGAEARSIPVSLTLDYGAAAPAAWPE